MKKAVIMTSLVALAFGLSQCKKESEEDLRGGGCDTENVSYSQDIAKIMSNRCNACHSTSARFGGIILDTYEDISVYVENDKLVCSVEHGSGCSPMPQGGGKISQCNIDKINAWINDGAQNN